MPIKVFGDRSDSETRFLEKIEGRFKKVDFPGGIKTFREFQKNPEKYCNGWLNEKEKELNIKKEEKNSLETELKEYLRKIDLIKESLAKKKSTLKKLMCEGWLKEKILAELSELESQLKRNKLKANKCEKLVTKNSKDLVNLEEEFKRLKIDLGDDVKALQEISYRTEFKNLIKGFVGENQVIEYLKSHFSDLEWFFLINGFSLNAIGRGLDFGKNFIDEDNIDHIIICEKGIIIIETKNWSDYQNYYDKVIYQLKRDKKVFTNFFGKVINPNFFRFVHVHAGDNQTNIPKNSEFNSLKLEDFYDYWSKLKTVFSNEEGIIVLSLLEPHMTDNQITKDDRLKIKNWTRSIKLRRKIKQNVKQLISKIRK